VPLKSLREMASRLGLTEDLVLMAARGVPGVVPGYPPAAGVSETLADYIGSKRPDADAANAAPLPLVVTARADHVGSPALSASPRMGASTPSTGGHGAAPGALIPASDMHQVPPLVLSLEGGGGTRVQYHVIPRHMRAASAGAGVGPIDGPEIDMAGDMAVTTRWLEANIGRTQGPLSTIEVLGDSMAPTLLEGETVVIDESAKTVAVDGIYVLEVMGRRVVKRVQRMMDGTITLISDNPAYQREQLDQSLTRRVQVIGRVVWPRLR
jgi:phage repressor protein C with HTH and peptisase S24 domain